MVRTGSVDSSAIEITIKQPYMYPGIVSMSLPGNRRLILSNSEECGINVGNNVNGAMTNDSAGTFPTSHKKLQRINAENRRTVKSSNGSVSSYSVVASRGEVARNNFSVCDVAVPVKKKPSIFTAKLRREDSTKKSAAESLSHRHSPLLQRKASKGDRNWTRVPGYWRNSIPKSQSAPTTLKEGYQQGARDKSPNRFAEAENPSILPRLVKHTSAVKKPQDCAAENNRSFSLLRESILVNKAKAPRRSSSLSSSFRALPSDWKKSPVKKSVSFSSDTTFKERRSPCKRTAVHESKVYRKGVLQDRVINEKTIRKVPPASEIPSGGFKALLRAAREGDDDTLRKLICRAQKSGLNDADININIADSSGRTAVSYMAGIGSASMLEAALSFPGVDPNLPDNEGNTPLHFAAQAGQTDCLNILLERCPDIEVDARNVLGFTPLMKAALQGRTKCAKILLFAGANPTLRDHGRGLRAEQWARFCGRYVCAEVIEKFARNRLLEKSTTTCRWGSEPELAVKVLQGKVTPVPHNPLPPPSTGLRNKIRRVFRSTSSSERNFSLVSQLTSAALCASSPALPKPGDVPPVVKSLLRPLSVPQLRITLVAPSDIIERTTTDKCNMNFSEKLESTITKPPRSKKKSK